MTRCRHCNHDTTEHTARGGCMHLHGRAICPCTWTSGRTQGSNPFTHNDLDRITTKGK